MFLNQIISCTEMLPVSISRRIYTAALTVIMIVSAAFPLPCAEESSRPARNEAVTQTAGFIIESMIFISSVQTFESLCMLSEKFTISLIKSIAT